MTPDDFLRSLDSRGPAPAYLFLGPEAFSRDLCRRALVKKALPEEDLEAGYIRHDLDSVELAAVLDDAQSFSLFARNRLIWVSGAEAALPRGRSTEDAEGAAVLEAYLRKPSPGTTVVFDCSRYEFDGDDKTKVQRVQKFYGAVRDQVEFTRYTPEMARRLAAKLAKERNLQIGADELEMLTEVLAGDAQRIASEIEKLSLYAGTSRKITGEDILALTPNAKASTIFALVNALGRRDRAASLDSLDVLVREGEYLPLALSFLGTQVRLALAAREAKLAGASQIQTYFSRQGTPMWRSRAEQVAQTAQAFSAARLKRALQGIYETDKALRDIRPDDRTVMEKFVLEMTA